ncbi:MAG: hypothetical protein NTY38_12965 [Acidobacteria bacterium]|nr:hypothetical protein [Acidobacteriota bacterium]
MRILFLGVLFAVAAVGANLSGVIADYDGVVMEAAARADGQIHLDTPRTIARLKELQANTFLYLIWRHAYDWDDLRREFLPAAQKAGINVWIYLVPPSECTPACSLPFGKDYLLWAAEAAKLSLQFPNLKAWAIDDFTHNLDLFTPAYLQAIEDAMHAVNPEMAFLPLVYWPRLTPEFVDAYAPRSDGFIMAYRDDPYRNTQITATLNKQVEAVSAMLARHGKPLMLMIYSSALSDAPVLPAPGYVEELVRGGLGFLRQGRIGGVITYILKKEEAPEPPSFNKARSGRGRASLAAVVSTAIPPAGAFAEAGQTVRVEPKAGAYSLQFWHQNYVRPKTSPGVYFSELLVDGKVVWEQEVTNVEASRWRREQVDLTPSLQGKRTARLVLRLTCRVAGRIYVDTSFDDLEAAGFTLADPDFESGGGWKVTRSDTAFLGAIDQFDPERPRKAFEAVRRLYGAAR